MQRALGHDFVGNTDTADESSQSSLEHHIRKSRIIGANLFSVTICSGCSGTGEPIHLGLFKDLESACLMNDGYELMCKCHFGLICLVPSDIDWLGFFILKRYDPVANGFHSIELISLLRDYLPDMSEDIDSVSRRCSELKYQLQTSSQSRSTTRSPTRSQLSSSSCSASSKEEEVEEFCSSDNDEPITQSSALTSSITPMTSSVSSSSPLTLVTRTSRLIHHLATYFPSCTFSIDPVNVAALPMTPYQEVPHSTLMATLLSLNKRPGSGDFPMAYMTAAVAGVLAKALNHTISAGVIVVKDPGSADSVALTKMKVDSGRIQLIGDDYSSMPLIETESKMSSPPPPPIPPTELTLSESTLAAVSALICTVFQDGRGYENKLLNWKLREICQSSALLPKTLFESSPSAIDLDRRLDLNISSDDDFTPVSVTHDVLGSLYDSFCGRVTALRYPNDWHDESVAVFEKMLCDLSGIPVTGGNIRYALFPKSDIFSFASASKTEGTTHNLADNDIDESVDLAKLVDENIIASIIWNVFGPIIATANGFAVMSKAAATLFTSVCANQGESPIERLDTSGLSPDERDQHILVASLALLSNHVAAAEARFSLTSHVMYLIQQIAFEYLKKTQKILRTQAALVDEARRSELLSALSLTKKISEKLKMAVNVLRGTIYLWYSGVATFRLALYDLTNNPATLNTLMDLEKKTSQITASCRKLVSGIEIDKSYILEWSFFNILAMSCYLEKGLTMIHQLNHNSTCFSAASVMEYLNECESAAKRFTLSCKPVGRLPFHADTMTPDTQTTVGYEFKIAVQTELLRYLLIVSALQAWLCNCSDANQVILSLYDPIPGDSSISVVFNGRRRRINFFDVMSELEVCCGSFEGFVAENGEGCSWFVFSRWLVRIIYVCNDFETRYKSSTLSSHSGSSSVKRMVLSTRSSCQNLLRMLRQGRPFTNLIMNKYLSGSK